ncbi:zinc finger protein 678-like isoform X2 [Uranotaenia lowii]|nr:zinc finger protein 678-like isoform X2 [Uranotaenia lowii]
MSSEGSQNYPESALQSRNRFCRLCLRKSENFLLPLMAKMEAVSVMEMLIDVTGLEIEFSPLYPTKVCSNCMTKLDFAYNVRQEFLSSAELLLKMAVENRLTSYYEQFKETGEKRVCYSDEILESSRNILESKIKVEGNKIVPAQEGPIIETVENVEGSDHSDIEMLDGLVDEGLSDHELDNALPANESKEEKQEKFVYSWRELVKPKKIKKSKVDIKNSAADKEIHDQFPPTTCYICNTLHDTLEQRDEHLNSHINMVPHRCETCSTEQEQVVSKSVLTLNRHRLMHLLPHKCDKCHRRFISTGSLYAHSWNTHKSNPDGMTCDYCGKIFTQKRSFQAHVRRHRHKANGRYKCDVCSETCGSNLLLARHMRKHTGEKNFTCPYCDKSFSRACNLLTHKRIHTNERCHKCSDCGSTFRDSVTLRKHQERFHLGKEPNLRTDRNPFLIDEHGRKLYICKEDDCDYRTYNGTAISRHKARHTKRYVCSDCGKRFAEPNLVRRHQASMHSGKVRSKKAATNVISTSIETECAMGIPAEVDELIADYGFESTDAQAYAIEVMANIEEIIDVV